MKTLIIGASGLVGSQLLQTSQNLNWQVTGTYNNNYSQGLVPLNIMNNDQVLLIFEKYKPDVVFLPAFISNVDYCEQYPEETYQVNVNGSLNVIRACQRHQVKLVFYSSDYIFDGKNGPYTEKDKPSPICIYGKQKLLVENYISDLLTNYLILRITVVYGYERQEKNFLIRLIRNLKHQKKIKVPTDQIGSPTLVNDIAQASCDLIKQNNILGTVHITSDHIMSRYEFALEASKVFNLPQNYIIPVKTNQLKQIAQRPLNAGLISESLKSNLNWNLKNVNQGLISLLNNQQFSNLISQI